MRSRGWTADDWRRVGTIIRNRRVEAGFNSQAAFARAVGVGARQIGGLESGEAVGPKTRLRIARHFQWPDEALDDMLDGAEAPQPEKPAPHYPDGLRDDVERQLWDLDLSEDDRWWFIQAHRLRGMTPPTSSEPSDTTRSA